MTLDQLSADQFLQAAPHLTPEQAAALRALQLGGTRSYRRWMEIVQARRPVPAGPLTLSAYAAEAGLSAEQVQALGARFGTAARPAADWAALVSLPPAPVGSGAEPDCGCQGAPAPVTPPTGGCNCPDPFTLPEGPGVLTRREGALHMDDITELLGSGPQSLRISQTPVAGSASS